MTRSSNRSANSLPKNNIAMQMLLVSKVEKVEERREDRLTKPVLSSSID